MSTRRVRKLLTSAVVVTLAIALGLAIRPRAGAQEELPAWDQATPENTTPDAIVEPERLPVPEPEGSVPLRGGVAIADLPVGERRGVEAANTLHERRSSVESAMAAYAAGLQARAEHTRAIRTAGVEIVP